MKHLRRTMRSIARRCPDERGAALVELTLAVPVLLGLMLGVFDVGMMLRSDITIANATRTATRVASNAGNAPTADYQLLRAFGAAVANVDDAVVNYVVVYKVTGSTKPPGGCFVSRHGGIPGACNTYSGADLAAVMTDPSVASRFGGSCSGGGWDTSWCPSTRARPQASLDTADSLGVTVSVTTPTYTHLFGATKTFTDDFVMRIEPSSTAGGR